MFRWKSEEQRKAVMAKLKKAALAGAVAGIGGYAAYRLRGTALGGKVAAIAGGALATAAGLAGSAYEKAKGLAEGTANWAATKIAEAPVEEWVAAGVNLPFTMVEGAIARDLERRVGRIERFTAARLGEAQLALTEKLAEKARKAHDTLTARARRTGMVSDRLAMHQWRARYDFLKDQSRRLRREVEFLKWQDAVGHAMRQALREGRNFLTASNEEVDAILRKAGIPATVENRTRLRTAWSRTWMFGSDIVSRNFGTGTL